MSLLKSKDLS